MSAGGVGRGVRTWDMGVSGSSPNDPVTHPALADSGLPGLLSGGRRGEDRSGTCTFLSPPFPCSGISPCALAPFRDPGGSDIPESRPALPGSRLPGSRKALG